MTEISRPWQGRIALGAVGDAGPYSSAQWRSMYRQFLGEFGESGHWGVYNTVGNELTVRAAAVPNTTVIVGSGAALVAGAYYTNDADIVFTVPANTSGNPRVDSIVLSYNVTSQTVRAVYLTGTPAVFPLPPLIQQDAPPTNIWQIELANIAVANVFATITLADIFSRRHFLNLPIGVATAVVLPSPAQYAEGSLLNFSPSLPNGTYNPVVSIDVGGSQSRTLGVLTHYQDNNAGNVGNGQILSNGYAVLTAGSAGVTQGQYLYINAVTGLASKTTPEDSIGLVLQTVGAGLRFRAYVNFMNINRTPYLKYSDVKASGTAGGTFTLGAWRTRDLNTEDSDVNGLGVLAANQITLQPGTYECIIQCPASQVDRHKARLQNITAGTTLVLGTSEFTPAGTAVSTTSWVRGRFTLTSASALEVQHQSTATMAGSGFGISTNIATVSEVYTVAEFYRICSA